MKPKSYAIMAVIALVVTVGYGQYMARQGK